MSESGVPLDPGKTRSVPAHLGVAFRRLTTDAESLGQRQGGYIRLSKTTSTLAAEGLTVLVSVRPSRPVPFAPLASARLSTSP